MRTPLLSLVSPMVKQGLTAKTIYEKLKTEYPALHKAPVYRVVKQLGGGVDTWKPSDTTRKRITKMVTNGLSYTDIAAVFGVTKKQINNLVTKRKLAVSPYKHSRKSNRKFIGAEELSRIYLIVLGAMQKRYGRKSEEIPSAVADAVLELQNKPKSDNPIRDCFGIAQRRLIDQIRAKRGRVGTRRQTVVTGSIPEYLENRREESYTLDTREEIDVLREKIASLDSPYREAIEAYLAGELKYTFVARTLGISEPTATKYVQIAMQRIRDEMREE